MGKLANSLKLKIAARLINKDRNRAFEIVKQVAESPVGLIATTDDDFVYNKGKFDNNWNNDFSVGVGTQHGEVLIRGTFLEGLTLAIRN